SEQVREESRATRAQSRALRAHYAQLLAQSVAAIARLAQFRLPPPGEFPQPATAPDGAASHAEEVSMTAHQSPREAASIGRLVDAWYSASRIGETTVLALPNAPAIYLTHQPRAQVRWRTEGRKGLTIPLADARERLAMVLGRP